MIQQRERLIDHREGDGLLIVEGDSQISVRYVVDTWREAIATGSGTSSELQRSDGLLWWQGVRPTRTVGILETADGRRLMVNLSHLRSNRAFFYCVG